MSRDRRDLSDAMKPGWNRHMSLQEASSSLRRLARYEPGVVAELPAEGLLRIEVNGVLAGVVHCLPDAQAELALGWAFLHGFFAGPGDIDSVTVHDGRVSLMLSTGVDLDVRRLAAVGWRDVPEEDDVPSAQAPAEPFAIHADVLLDLVRVALRAMAADRSRDGFVHAAIASDTVVHCVARDLTVDNAVAKVLGWVLRMGRDTETPVLLTRGIVDRIVVSAAARLGVGLIVTTGIPTADAFREATGREVSILGMAANQRPGLLVDAGHVIEDDELGGRDS